LSPPRTLLAPALVFSSTIISAPPEVRLRTDKVPARFSLRGASCAVPYRRREFGVGSAASGLYADCRTIKLVAPI
jgi:hypothetical protein